MVDLLVLSQFGQLHKLYMFVCKLLFSGHISTVFINMLNFSYKVHLSREDKLSGDSDDVSALISPQAAVTCTLGDKLIPVLGFFSP